MREIKFRVFNKIDKIMRIVKTMTFDSLNPDCEYMQYTGLKDKNGKEIYEGDVIRCFSHTEEDREFDQIGINKIIYEEDFTRFSLEQEKLDYGESTFYFCGIEPDFILKVIGNIYENPELLK